MDNKSQKLKNVYFFEYQLFIVLYNSSMSLQDHQPDTSGFYNLCIHMPLALVKGVLRY